MTPVAREGASPSPSLAGEEGHSDPSSQRRSTTVTHPVQQEKKGTVTPVVREGASLSPSLAGEEGHSDPSSQRRSITVTHPVQQEKKGTVTPVVREGASPSPSPAGEEGHSDPSSQRRSITVTHPVQQEKKGTVTPIAREGASSVRGVFVSFSLAIDRPWDNMLSKTLFLLLLKHAVILHRLENRTRPISTPHDGQRRWSSNLRSPACEKPFKINHRLLSRQITSNVCMDLKLY